MKKLVSGKIGALLSFNTILTLFLVCSVAINVLLARRVAALKKEADDIAQGRNLKPGTPVPPMDVKSLDGSPASVSHEGSPTTVFYVFSVTCHWCEQNLDNIKALSASASRRYRFVGISLDRDDPAAIRDYVSKNGLSFPVYYSPSLATLKSYKLGGTPHTIVVSPEGKVVSDWAGAYTLETKSEVENFFAVSLPGIRPMSADATGQTIH
ncbi:MAG: TlpA family protein disulfide reductase [Acidobacteriota bacterium]|nr:TlpA family protein disulfide reductase [Acidobacteriota bacterium]